MKQGEGISTHTLNKLCEILDCAVEDVITYQKDIENEFDKK